MISEENIQRIVDANDIVEVIGGYFPLKRAGSNYRALCPFHTEKSPSFNVNPHRQIYHCFGCQRGGDVIRFVMEYENLPFPDAARKLAERGGVLIEEEAFDPKQEAGRQMRREIQTLHRKVTEWFNYLLFKKPFAQEARDYLKSRGISMDTAREWQFGYAPEHGGTLIDWALAEGYTIRHLVEGGLANMRDENRPDRGAYAFFRHRLMFPVANDMGDVIAFSGRVLRSDQGGGKYVNSRDTILFNKSKTFFGFDKSKRAVLREGRAIVCEGQLDMIAAFEAGLENTVAPLGTAFTELHARAMKRHTDEVVLCYDSDEAGYGAIVKAFQQLAKVGVLVRVALLPPGEDPDSLIKSQGADVLKELIENAPEFFDYQIDRRGGSLKFDALRDRINFAGELAANIALVEDKMLQDSLVSRVTTRLGVGETEIRRLIRDAKRDADRADRAINRREAIERRQDQERSGDGNTGNGGNGSDSIQQGSAGELTLSNRSVKFLCQLLLSDATTREKLTVDPPPEFLRDIPETELLGKIWQADFDPASPGSIAAFTGKLNSAEQNCVVGLLNSPLPESAGEFAGECLEALRRLSLQSRIREIQSKLKNPEILGQQVDNLTKELLDLTKQLNDIPAPPNGGA